MMFDRWMNGRETHARMPAPSQAEPRHVEGCTGGPCICGEPGYVRAEPAAVTDLVDELREWKTHDQAFLLEAADEIERLREQVRELEWKLTCAEYSGDHNIADLHEWQSEALKQARRGDDYRAALRELLACLDPTPREGRHDWLGHYDADECVFCDRGETGEHKANCPMKIAEAAFAQEEDE